MRNISDHGLIGDLQTAAPVTAWPDGMAPPEPAAPSRYAADAGSEVEAGRR